MTAQSTDWKVKHAAFEAQKGLLQSKPVSVVAMLLRNAIVFSKSQCVHLSSGTENTAGRPFLDDRRVPTIYR